MLYRSVFFDCTILGQKVPIYEIPCIAMTTAEDLNI